MARPPAPSPFAGTAPYYDRFRAPYAPAAIAHLIATCGLDASARVLDLGCGPGTIAIPLSRAAGEVVAVDPDAGMLAEARRLAAAQGRDNIQWHQARAEDLDSALARVRLATFGQSFHWMDRDRVLASLADLIEPGGGLALLNPGKRRPQESWEPTANEVIARFLGLPTRHPSANPSEPTHEPALRRSAHFSHFTTQEFSTEITRDIPAIIGCVYATSSSSHARFGNATPEFEAALTAALRHLNPTGIFRERLETELLIAPKRPA